MIYIVKNTGTLLRVLSISHDDNELTGEVLSVTDKSTVSEGEVITIALSCTRPATEEDMK